MKIIEHFRKKFLSKPEPRFSYQAIGEENGVYTLVKNFYEIMENDPYAKKCLDTHQLTKEGNVPDEVKKKLFMFLCGWFGGPQLFIEAYGHPRMAARHAHVKVSKEAKEQWLFCIKAAIKKHPFKMIKEEKENMINSFTALANRIQNV